MKRRLLITVLLSLLFGTALLPPVWAAESRQPQPSAFNEEALVYIAAIGLVLPDSNISSLQYKGLRMGFAVAGGRYIVTAAHCVDDIKNSASTYFCPFIISRYYGDIVAAEVVAVDEPNDIAILKPVWDVHPALELDTGDQWKTAPKIRMAAYPPPDKKRGGNGHLACSIVTETAPLIKNPKDIKHKVIVGPIRYPGPGWSGSPYIVPQTGKVAGLLAREAYGKKWFIIKRRLTTGPDASAIRRLFEQNALCCDASEVPLPDRGGEKQFQQIVSFWDALTDDINRDRIQITRLCTAQPESPVLNSLGGILLSDPNDCLEHGRRATEVAPQNAFARLAYGTLLSREKRGYRKAAAEFGYAAELDPDNRFAHHLHLKMLADTDPNAAVALGQELTTRWPDEADFWFEYARALRNQNKRSEELPLIQKAVFLAPSGKVPYLHQRYLADALAASEQNEAAEQAYETLLKTHQCRHCWNTYADFLGKIHKPDQAAQARQNAKTKQNENTVGK